MKYLTWIVVSNQAWRQPETMAWSSSCSFERNVDFEAECCQQRKLFHCQERGESSCYDNVFFMLPHLAMGSKQIPCLGSE